MNDLDVYTRRRTDRKMWRRAFVASLFLHLVVLIAGSDGPIPVSPFAAAGPKADDDRAAAGGMQTVNLAAPPPRPIVRPRTPLPVEIEIEPVELEDEVMFDVATLLGERPGLEIPGIGDGEGEGDGGTATDGLRRLLPPTPRGMIIPPANRDLRGVEVQVWVFVDATGKVVADSTRLDPPTRDRGFNRQLIREAAEWVFRPGTEDGQPVAAWFPYRISM